MTVRNCEQCNKPLTEGSSPRQWFCSLECKRRAERERKLAAAAFVACPVPGCANVFKRHNRHHRYCSDRCRQAMRRLRVSVSREKRCHQCDKTFIPKPAYRKYCSRSCLARHNLAATRERYWNDPEAEREKKRRYREKHRDELMAAERQRRQRNRITLDQRICAQCYSVFQPWNKRQRFCSPTCRQSYDAAKKRRQYQPRQRPLRCCLYCKREFVEKRSGHLYCTRRCRQRDV